jgi:hypothetical protein
VQWSNDELLRKCFISAVIGPRETDLSVARENWRNVSKKVTWKYVIGSEPVSMPKGAEILSVQEQRDEICVWALVDPSRPVNLR